MRTFCTQFWEFIGSLWRSIDEHVFVPWRLCKFWYCYLGLVVLFIVLIHIVIVLTILVWMVAFLCEVLCFLTLITSRRGGTCLVFSASPPPPPVNLAPNANAGGPYYGRVGKNWANFGVAVCRVLDGEGAVLPYLRKLPGDFRRNGIYSPNLISTLGPRLRADPKVRAVLVQLGYAPE
jgi:hypothetical protein